MARASLSGLPSSAAESASHFRHGVRHPTLRPHAERVVDPLGSRSAEAVVNSLRPLVVPGGLPGEFRCAMPPAFVDACADQLVGDACSACSGRVVEVAVRADQRQQLGEIGTRHPRDRYQSNASKPTVRPGGRPRSFSSASITPGTNASRENVSWRIVNSCPSPPKSTSWCARSPGSRTEWIAGSPPSSSAVAFAVPDGASFFASLWSSTISARGINAAASRAKRIIKTAPSAKFGAWKHPTPASRASSSMRAWSKPVVPMTQGSPGSTAAVTFGSTASGAVKSTIASASWSSTSSCPATSSAGARTRPTLPPRPLRTIFICRAKRGHKLRPAENARHFSRLSRSARERGRIDSSRGPAEYPRAWPDPGDRQLLRREQQPGELGDLVRLDGLDLRDDPLEGEQLRVRDERLAESAHPIRGRLHREHDPTLQVLLRTRELVRPEVARRDVEDLLAGDLQTGREVLLTRPDVDANQAGVRVLRGEGVDGIRHAPLLADLLEEARRGRAAEDVVEQRGGEAPPVGARDPGSAHADVVLLGVLLREAKPRRRGLHQRSPHTRPARGRALLALRALQHPHEPVVLDVPRRSDDDIPARVHLPVVRGENTLRHRRDHLRGADHRPSEGVASEDRLREQIVDELLRCVLVHGDLLEYDLALRIELGESGREHHVGHHVERRLDMRI